MNEGSQIRRLLDPARWSCLGAQVKDRSHVVIWMACKRTPNPYETSCGSVVVVVRLQRHMEGIILI